MPSKCMPPVFIQTGTQYHHFGKERKKKEPVQKRGSNTRNVLFLSKKVATAGGSHRPPQYVTKLPAPPVW